MMESILIVQKMGSERILVGALTALVIVTTMGFWASQSFSKSQKILLSVCILFPPVQWVLAFVLYLNNKKGEIKIHKQQNKHSKNLDELKQLKESGILSEKEYQEKLEKINAELILNEIKQTNQYKSLSELKKQGILTDNEFDEKIQMLSSGYNLTLSSDNNFKYSIKDITIPKETYGQIIRDKTFLIHTIKDCDRFIKYFATKNYPFYAALLLDDKNVKLEPELINNLLIVAKRDFGVSTINEVFEIIANE